MPKRDILSARIILTICFKDNSRTERWIYRPQSILQTLAFNNNNNNNISIRIVYSIHHRVSLEPIRKKIIIERMGKNSFRIYGTWIGQN